MEWPEWADFEAAVDGPRRRRKRGRENEFIVYGKLWTNEERGPI
jgi:hypothetical protein